MTRVNQQRLGLAFMAVILLAIGTICPQDADAQRRNRAFWVNVCHNDQVHWVRLDSLPNHLNHGDHFVGSEICDGRDNNCNGEIDEGLEDYSIEATCPCEAHPELIDRIFQATGRGRCDVEENRTGVTVLASSDLRYTAQVAVDNVTARPVIWIGDFNNFNDPTARVRYRCEEEVPSQSETCTAHILATKACMNGG